MDADSAKAKLDKRTKLLKQVKRGRQTGIINWTRLFMILVSAGAMFGMISDAFSGKENFKLLTSQVLFVFIFALSVMGLGVLELNKRFDDLIELIGEENLRRPKDQHL